MVKFKPEKYQKKFVINGEFCEVRPAYDFDVPAIRLLVNTAYKDLADLGLNYTATYQDEDVTRARIQKGCAFVLECSHQIVGTVLFTEENLFTGFHSGYVSQLAVSPSKRKLGLASYLMKLCERIALEEGYNALQLDTAKPAHHLVSWYQRMGYVIVGEKHWDGKTYDSYIFEKILKNE